MPFLEKMCTAGERVLLTITGPGPSFTLYSRNNNKNNTNDIWVSICVLKESMDDSNFIKFKKSLQYPTVYLTNILRGLKEKKILIDYIYFRIRATRIIFIKNV